MNIGQIKVWPTKHNVIKANGTVTLDDVLNVKFTVINGSKGLFVTLPQQVVDDKETGGKKYYPEVSFPKSDKGEAFRNELTKAILSAYTNIAGGTSLNQGEAPGPTNQEDCPF